MFHYGNWCGPGWSNGQKRASVRGTAPAVDEFDETCRQHDFAYADSSDLRSADLLFARSNIGKGFTRTMAAMAVGIQGLTRSIDKFDPQNIQKMTKIINDKTMKPAGSKKGNLRGSNPPPARSPTLKAGISQLMAPASIGTTIRATKPVLTRGADTSRMTGRDFLGTVEGEGVATFGLGKSALLSPAYFASTFLGNIARSYEQYRWNKLVVHYVPKVPTSVTGQIVLCSQRSASEPGLQPESGTFLQRAMSQGNAVFSPLWVATQIEIDCDGEFKLIDPGTTVDIDDCIHEELQVYTQVNSSQQVGYLFVEYDVTFKEPIYQPHSTLFPIPSGPGVRTIVQASTAANAVTDSLLMNEVASVINIAGTANGSIFRGVFDLQGSTAPTGTTFANAFNVITVGRGLLGVQNLSTTAFPLIGGTTLYFVVQGTVLDVYTSLDAATDGNGSGQLVWRTLSTTAGALKFDMAQVRFGVAVLPQVQ